MQLLGRIEKRDIEDIFALSPMQEGMLFHFLEHPESDQYLEQLAIRVKGRLNLKWFREAWEWVATANEMLRTVPRWEKLAKPLLVLLRNPRVEIRYNDLRHHEPVLRETELQSLIKADRREQFTFESVPFRLGVVCLEEERHVVIITFHHILFDGWSTGVILKEFFAAYQALAANTLPERTVKPGFKQFIKQLELLPGGGAQVYWKEHLAGLEIGTQLPIRRYEPGKDGAGPDVASSQTPEIADKKAACSSDVASTGKEAASVWTLHSAEKAAECTTPADLAEKNSICHPAAESVQKHTFFLAADTANELVRLSQEQNLTPATIFYAAWGVLLQKLNYRQDSVFGTTVSGRNIELAGIEHMVGLFINTVPLRIKTSSEQTVLELLREMQMVLNQRRDFERTPLLEIKQSSGVRTGENLFDSLIAIENYPLENVLLNENGLLSMESYDMYESTNFPLTISIEMFKEIKVSLIAQTGVFAEGFIERIATHFERMVVGLVQNPLAQIKALTLLTLSESSELLRKLHDTVADYPRDKVIHQLFEEQAERYSTRVALVANGTELTYGELNRAANQLAWRLRQSGVGPDKIVAIMVERSTEMLIGLLAILKAGGAYLPILPEYPEERVRYMLEDSQAQVLLTQPHLRERVDFAGVVVTVTNDCVAKNHLCSTNLPNLNQPGDLAYIIYTSGSTGRPKGVMVEHRNVVRLMFNDKFLFNFTERDVWTLFHSFSFDFSVWEMYGALLYGGKLVVVPSEVAKDTRAFRELLRREQVTVLNQTPSAFYNLLAEEMQCPDSDLHLRYIIFGGEALNVGALQPWQARYPETKLINMYGITETTVHVTFKELAREDIQANISNIGRPLPTLRVYILDEHLQLLPPDMIGEICVGGDGVARGYLHRPELTAERFIPDPYCPGERLYRSGDLARLLPSGELEYRGRADQQVKIRGFRVEPGEIENQLLRHPVIDEAIVLVRESSDGERALLAYFASREEISLTELRSHLRATLPEYMVPAHFTRIERLPITANGKVDKNALLEMAHSVELSREYAAPTDPIEEILINIWREVLNIDQPIGVTDNFFDLGGHSLKMTALVSKIYREFNVPMALTEVFAAPTVRELAQRVRRAQVQLFEALAPVEVRADYPLTSAQKRLYVLQQMAEDSLSYNMTGVLRLAGQIDQERLALAVEDLINRHESLRTSFCLRDGEPVQRVHEKVEIPVEIVQLDPAEELAESSVSLQSAVLKRTLQNVVRPFALDQAPLLRVKILKLQPAETLLILDMHHIIADGISLTILQSELLELYAGKTLPPLPVQYKDYAVAADQLEDSEEWQRQKDYWLNQFTREIPVLNLPTDYPRPSEQEFSGDSVHFKLTVELMQQLQNLARQQKATLYMVLLAAYTTLLYRYTGQTDVVVGSPVAGRPVEEVQQVVGMFVNTLALRNRPAGQKTFTTLLAEVKENALHAYENQIYPLEELLEDLHLERDLSRNPLFDTVLALQNMEQLQGQVGDMQVEIYPHRNRVAKFDLSFIFHEGQTGLDLELEYSTQLFAVETVQQMGQHFINILQAAVVDPEVKLGKISIISAEEHAHLLRTFEGAKMDLPEVTVQQIFGEQVKAAPERLALIYRGQQMTYGELDARTGRLASFLREKGVRREAIVAIMCENSPEQVVAVLATLKAGGAFLPIASDTPRERVEFMLQDANALVLLTDRPQADDFYFSGKVISVNDWPAVVSDEVGIVPEEQLPEVEPHDLAYVIYTSGTTGRPKGVQIEHRSLLNLCLWHNRQFAITADDRATRLAGFGFDAALWEMLPYLLQGARLYIIPDEMKLNLPLLNQYMEEEQITVAFLPTQLAERFMQLTNRSLRLLLTGGDKLNYFVQHPYQLANNYGPTENTVVSTCHFVNQPERNIPIGRPVENVRVYILDADQNLQPFGVPGELCLQGMGLARGYLNQPELTAEKFTADPFKPGERLYHTKDRAMYLRDGNIAFLGRMDGQVQLRGYRIEIGEIESVLLRHSEIEGAVVVLEEDVLENGVIDKGSLVAYLITQRDMTRKELRQYLATTLPGYMIPASFRRVAAFPLTANGKVDRRELQKLGTSMASGVEYRAPETVTEMTLAEIWAEILGSEVGCNDNFFELGGHSLKAVSMVGEIQKRCQVTIPLSAVFTHPTVAELAEVIIAAKQEQEPADLIQPAESAPYYPLTPVQKRMYVLHQMDTASVAYNMPTLLRVSGNVDPVRLERAFCCLIERHRALRTGFTLVRDEAVQTVATAVAFNLQQLTANPDTLSETVKEFVRPFDLQKPPLVRAALIQVAGADNLLLIDFHHIIADGQSLQIFIREIVSAYDMENLAPLAVQYTDYAVWSAEHRTPEVIRAQETYWLNEFAGEIPVLDLPTDFPRPAIQSFEGGSVKCTLDAASFERLKAVLAGEQATLYMACLASYTILLSKLTGQEDIILGMPISARNQRELEGVMGMFVNTLAIRSQPRGDMTFTQFLKQVKAKTLNAFDHQDYPFEDLVDRVVVKRDLSRNPLFDTMLVLQNFETTQIQGDSFIVAPYPQENTIAKFDLELSAYESGGDLQFILDYCTQLFKPETVKRFCQYLIRIMQTVAMKPEVRLADLSILSEEEREQLIYGFNDNIAEFPRTQSVYHFVERFAAETPDKVAVICDGQTLTYAALNAQVNQLARLLTQYGVAEDQLVGILLDRSPLMAISILAVWKAGGAYIPLDPEYPAERIATILSDSAARVLLTSAEYNPTGESGFDTECAILMLDSSWSKVAQQADTNLDLPLNMHSLAYVIYTSGSTGKPKGAMVEHIGMMNHMQAKINDLHLTEQCIVAQNASQCFDISVWQFFVALRMGGTTVIYTKELVLTPAEFIDRVIGDRVSILEVVPSYLAALLDTVEANFRALPDVQYLLVTGEIVKPPLVKRWFGLFPAIPMVNAYGPTEASDDITHHIMTEVPEVERIPVGRPVQNFHIYIVDNYMQLVPVGVKGEICVSGIGVGRGYLNNPEKTEMAFTQDPFMAEERRLYKTGDLGRWLPDGVIDFFGRKDYQVKIRGFRIELGEIESVLATHPEVKEAVVLDREDTRGQKYLAAYIVAIRELTMGEMREYLAQYLPDYMIPTELLQLQQIPLNPNGKVDRKALMALESQASSGASTYLAPESDLERRIADIWKEVLLLEQVGVNDNFFDVGGNSLDIIAVKNKLVQEFSLDFSVVTLFKYPTIRTLVRHLEQLQAAEQVAVSEPEMPHDRSEAIDKGKDRLKQRMRRRSDQ